MQQNFVGANKCKRIVPFCWLVTVSGLGNAYALGLLPVCTEFNRSRLDWVRVHLLTGEKSRVGNILSRTGVWQRERGNERQPRSVGNSASLLLTSSPALSWTALGQTNLLFWGLRGSIGHWAALSLSQEERPISQSIFLHECTCPTS